MPIEHGYESATLNESDNGSHAPPSATWHTGDEGQASARGESLQQIDVDLLRPGRYQPRQDFSAAALEELADSIRAEGVVQPLVVRRLVGKAPQRYEIIAGERRWRAAQLAGLPSVPAVVREVDDHTALAQALVENIQREDLNPVEQARGIQRLVHEFSLTHQEAAARLGRSRDTVTHLLRILKLDPEVLQRIEEGALSLGHAKLLVGQSGPWQRFLAQETAREGLTVRQLEKRVRALDSAPTSNDEPSTGNRNADLVRLESRVTELVGAQTRVDFEPTQRRGRLAFSFHSLDELQGLLERLGYVDD